MKLGFKAHRCDHMQTLLQALHWLLVQTRIEHKLSTFCHNISDSTPAYLSQRLWLHSTPAYLSRLWLHPCLSCLTPHLPICHVWLHPCPSVTTSLTPPLPISLTSLCTPLMGSFGLLRTHGYFSFPRFKPQTFGQCSFSYCAPKQWSCLPLWHPLIQSSNILQTAFKTIPQQIISNFVFSFFGLHPSLWRNNWSYT